MDTHYGTLGVPNGAEPDVVRKAYLDLARQLHPDRWIDASTAERSDVDRRMREVNEAWRVLGNPARRLAYDVELREAGRRPRVSPPTGVGERYAFSTGDLFTEDVAPPDAVTRVFRALPWLLIFAALGAIFIFTAYATSNNGSAPGQGERCIQKVAGDAVDVDCGEPGSQRVIIEVRQVGECPFESEPFQPATGDVALCLAPPS
jgi:DnaJ-class molecular chaperone